MRVRMEKRPAFQIAGLSVHDGVNSDFVGTWDRLFEKVSMDEMSKLGTDEFFGACYDFRSNQDFSYLAGAKVLRVTEALSRGLEILQVPESEYAIFELHGKVPQCIHEGWAFANETYLKEHGLRHAQTPDFEYYLPGDMSSADYEMELWIPVTNVGE